MPESQITKPLQRKECSTLNELLKMRALTTPDAQLYRFIGENSDEAITYRGLHDAALAIAAQLSTTTEPGDRVLLLFKPGLAYIRAFFGCLYAGRIAVPLYPPKANARGGRVTGALFDCQASAALTDDNDREMIARFLKGVGLQHVHVFSQSDVISTVDQAFEVTAEDIAFLQYTSGSTGSPKGVMVSHGNLLANQATIQQAFGTSETDVCFNWLPLYHDMGLIGNVLHPLYMGFSSILTSPTAFIRDPLGWLEGIDRLGATVAGAPNFAYDLLCRRVDHDRLANIRLDNWRVAYNGAEPVRPETMTRFTETFGRYGFTQNNFYPCYGMAEATLFISGGTIGEEPETLRVDKEALTRGEAIDGDEALSLTSCGSTFEDHDVLIAHPESREALSPRKVGEIWFKGPSKTLGYWQKPELNKTTFDAHTSDGDGGWMRTGDLGFVADNRLFVTGRLKDLIIVRGRNHYPQDIEQTAEESAAILKTAAAFTLEEGGEEHLAIAVEIERRAMRGFDSEATAASLREAVAQQHELSVDLVIFLKTGSLPKTSSGKKQRFAARDGYLQGTLAVVGVDAVGETALGNNAPGLWQPKADSLEDKVRHIIAVGLRRNPDKIAPTKGLTAQGMDSMAAVEIQRAVLEDFQVEVPMVDLLSGISPEQLCTRIGEGQKVVQDVDAMPWTPGETIPLSHNQESLFFHNLLAGDATPHNLSFAARLHKALDPGRLQEALKQLQQRHPILATTYRVENSRPVQAYAENAPLDLSFVEGAEWSSEARDAYLKDEIAKTFDLENGPIYRVRVIETDQPVLLVCVHHIAVDFQGLIVMLEDLAQLYAGEHHATPSCGYRDFVNWQRSPQHDQELEGHFEHWQKQLADEPPVIALPRDFARATKRDYAGGSHTFIINGQIRAGLEKLASAQQTTLFTTLLASYVQFLHRYTGQDDVLVGTPISQRQQSAFADVVGYLANMAMVRDDAGTCSLADAVTRTHQNVLDVHTHGHFPFHQLVKRLKPERSAHHPFFQTAFVLQHTDPKRDFGPFALGMEGGSVSLGEWQLESLSLPTVGSQFDLTLTLAAAEDHFVARIDYASGSFLPQTITQFADLFSDFLGSALADPTRDTALLPLVPSHRQKAILDLGRANYTDMAMGETLIGRFEAMVAQHGDKPAVHHGEMVLTYSELNARANGIALALQERGVGGEDFVGLFCKPSIHMIAGVLGILKCGAAYVPMDPDYPQERLSFLIEDSHVKLLLHDGDISAPEGVDHSLVLQEIADAAAFKTPGIDPQQASYIIYTSGSTGRPKGTLITHHNVMRLFTATEEQTNFSADDTWTLFHSFSFDFSVWEIWGPLLYGGKLLIVDKSVSRSPAQFADLLVSQRVTVLNQTPSAFYPLTTQLCRRDPKDVALRWVIFGGEALTVRNLTNWFAHFQDQGPRLVNMYGITETCVHVTWREILADDLNAPVSPIGLPIQDLETQVLDSRLNPIPQGVNGELFVGGAGLARGYWNQPGLTATRFIPHPYATQPGARLYKSGDGARFSQMGDLEYQGRLDAQVKVRGFRIEVGEIAAALRKHPELDQVIVMVQSPRAKDVRPAANHFAEGKTGATVLRNLLKMTHLEKADADDKRLVAYFTGNSEALPSGSQLRTFLAQQLPEHMIPSHFISLEAFPLTNNGKLDTKALPQPGHGRPMLDTQYTAPRTPQEKAMADVWAEILQLDRVGIDDPFFDLGGDSIVSIRLKARAAEEGLDFSLQDLMAQKTIRGLMSGINAEHSEGEAYQPVKAFQLIGDEDRAAMPEVVEDAYPLARLQEGLLFHSSFSQDIPMYCDIFIYQFRAPFDEGIFREALAELASRHHILRTAFDFDGFSEPLQLVHREVEIPLHVEAIAHLDEEARGKHLNDWLTEEKRRNYDWKQPPLMRFNAFLLDEDEFYLGMSFHDVLMDGWSESSILTELLSLYFTLLKGQRPAEPEGDLAFRDFIALERSVLADEDQWQFWSEELSDPVVAGLPTKGDRHGHFTEPRMAFLDVDIDAGLSEELKALATQAGSSLKHVLLAAHCRILNLLTGQHDVLTALESNGRLEAMGGETVLGCHLNAVPFRFKTEATTWLDFVRAVHAKETAVAPYRRFPYAEIQRRIGGETLFDTSFNYTHFHVYRQLSALEDLDILGAHAYIQTHFALRVEFNQDPFSGNISLDLEADENKLTQTQLQHIAVTFQNVLKTMVREPNASVGASCLLPEDMAKTLLVDWNDTYSEEKPDLTHVAFKRQVAQRPDQIVATDAHLSVTYSELDVMSDRIAATLRKNGIAHEGLVAIMMNRSIAYLAMILGTFKAGGAYLPLAPNPVDRASKVLKQAKADALVCHRADGDHARKIMGQLADDVPSLLFVEDLLAASVEGAPEVWDDNRERLANIFFTSGSTGEPKGAMIHYGGMANHQRSKIHMMEMSETDLVSQDAAQTFDISLWQMVAASMVGGRVIIFPDEIAKDPIRLFHAVNDEGVTILEVSPAVLGVFVEEAERLGERRPAFEKLRYLPCSGEALPPETCRRWLALYPHVPVINMWGATECSDDVSWVKVTKPPARDVRIMPLGYPIGDIQILLLDRFGQLASNGTQGELYIGGNGVGLGYRRDPVRTALAFRPNPFAGCKPGMPAGSRLYKTGDLGRMRPDGQAEFLGRTDHQVKIRGHRVELGDIEAALLRAPEVSQALVITAKDARGDHYLAAYLCPLAPQTPEGLDLSDLRTMLAEQLPAYMLPSTYIVLPEFPRNVNGKVDRKMLPEPELQMEDDSSGAPPQTESEKVLANIWAELLEMESVGRDQDFFLLGGHSLLATRVASRIREHFKQDISIRTLFEHTTIAELGAILDDEPVSSESKEEAIVPIPDQDFYGLSFAQNRLWVLDQLEGEHGTYNMASRLTIRGPLSLSALRFAMAKIIERHESLRTTFHQDGDTVYQKVSQDIDFEPQFFDLSTFAPDERRAKADQYRHDASRMRFELDRGPLLDIMILCLSPDEYEVLITMHHIISDGWSGGVMVRELAAHYAACGPEVSEVLPPLPIQYRDFAHWQQNWFKGPRRDEQIAYWKNQLAGAPPLLDLPTDYPRPAVQSFEGSEIKFQIPAETCRGLQRLAEAEGLSMFMVLHGMFAVLLSHYSGERDIVVGSPVANRDRAEIEGLIGFFVNTLVLRTTLEPNQTLRENLHAVRETDLQAFANQHLPFEQLVDALQPERNLSHNPLFQVMLVLQNASSEPITLPGLDLEYELTRSETSKFDMLLSIQELEDTMEVTWEYATDLFSSETIEGMAAHFRRLLADLPEQCDQPLHTLSPTGEAEATRLLESWNPAADPLEHTIVHHFFEAQAQRTPDAVALIAGETRLTYRELDGLANAVAVELIAKGVGMGQLVGLAVERNAWAAVGLLAVLKAGAAYVPLDPNYPEARLRYMIEDAAAPVILSEKAVAGVLPQQVPLILLDETRAKVDQAPELEHDPLQAAYGIYTSGSTGKPKCTIQNHRALSNMIQFFAKDVGSDNDRTFMYASMSFDVHLMEFFGAWAQGHTVYMVAEALRRDPEALLHFTHEHGLSRVVLPVVILHAWAEIFPNNPERFEHLRHLGSTGEHLTINAAVKYMFNERAMRLSNYYGPTETHVITAHTLLGDTTDWPFNAPIGTTLANTQTYLLNTHLQPVPAGAKGYLFSGGMNVATGYHGRPALTAEKFIPDPFASEPGARMYATGDLARYASSPASSAPPLEYLGRRDHMVKLRGFRIEPGEIAALMGKHERVRYAHVALVRLNEKSQLVAWLQQDGEQTTKEAWVDILKAQLPAYMVPHHFVYVEDLPLSPNGKVDVRRLPIPTVLHGESAQEMRPPETAAERWLAKQFQELVKEDVVSLDHNFFELGGHSITATQLSNRVAQGLSLSLSPRDIFQHPTVSGLVEVLAETAGDRDTLEQIAEVAEEIDAMSDDEVQKLL